MSDTPVELVYVKLWEVLGDFSGSGVKVRPGNLIDYSKLKPKDKGSLSSSADMPEIKCVLAGSRWDNTGVNSNQEAEIQQFDLVVATGELQLREQLKLKWYVRQKIWDAKSLWQQIQYKGGPFCTRVQYTSVFEGLRENSDRSKLLGWTSVITLDTYMQFSHAQMSFESNP